MEIITTDEVMNKLDMFQYIFVKVDKFGWWDLLRIQTDTGTQFNSKEFQESIFVHGLHHTLATPDHQEMNGTVEVTWKTLITIAH